jgi:hypothetical protein
MAAVTFGVAAPERPRNLDPTSRQTPLLLTNLFGLTEPISGLLTSGRVRKREVGKAMRDGCNVPERVQEEFLDLEDGN